MAFAAVASTTEPRSFSLGPIKMELQTFSMVSTDTSGSVTSARLSRVDDCIVIGLGSACQTSAPSISGKVVTLAFADPSAGIAGYVAKNINGYVILLGR